MKTSMIFKSFEALPHDQDEWQSDRNQSEQSPRYYVDRADVLYQPPAEPFPPFTPRQWGINE